MNSSHAGARFLQSPGLGIRALLLGLVWAATGAEAEVAPDRTLDTYGTWVMRCERMASETGERQQACEIMQTFQLQGDATPLTRVAIGRPSAGEDLLMVLQLPLGMWLPAGVALDLGPEGGRHQAALRRCLPGGCIAEISLTDAIAGALRNNDEGQSHIELVLQAGSPARVPVLHRGFGAAFDALIRRLDER